jgi:hypothetical protein
MQVRDGNILPVSHDCVELEQRQANLIGTMDENGLDTNGYHLYYICFHISVGIQIQIQILSTMPDRIWLDVDIINMQFDYSDTDTVSDVEYPDSDTDTSEPL